MAQPPLLAVMQGGDSRTTAIHPHLHRPDLSKINSAKRIRFEPRSGEKILSRLRRSYLRASYHGLPAVATICRRCAALNGRKAHLSLPLGRLSSRNAPGFGNQEPHAVSQVAGLSFFDINLELAESQFLVRLVLVNLSQKKMHVRSVAWIVVGLISQLLGLRETVLSEP